VIGVAVLFFTKRSVHICKIEVSTHTVLRLTSITVASDQNWGFLRSLK